MVTEKQRFACTAINKLSIELEKMVDGHGQIYISTDKLDEITMRLKREIRGDYNG